MLEKSAGMFDLSLNAQEVAKLRSPDQLLSLLPKICKNTINPNAKPQIAA